MKFTGFYKKRVQLQSARGDLLKRCSEDNCGISRKTFLRSCNLKKITSELYFNHTQLFSFSQKFYEYFLVILSKQFLALVFSCECCEISKNTFFTEHLWTTASKFNALSVLNEHKDIVDNRSSSLIEIANRSRNLTYTTNLLAYIYILRR